MPEGFPAISISGNPRDLHLGPPLPAASQSRAHEPSSAVSPCIDSGQRYTEPRLVLRARHPLFLSRRQGVRLTGLPRRPTEGLRATRRIRVPRRLSSHLPFSRHASPASRRPLELSSLILSSSASRSAQFRSFSLRPRLERPRLRVAHESPER